MGFWGYGPFENDYSMDQVHFLTKNALKEAKKLASLKSHQFTASEMLLYPTARSGVQLVMMMAPPHRPILGRKRRSALRFLKPRLHAEDKSTMLAALDRILSNRIWFTDFDNDGVDVIAQVKAERAAVARMLVY